MSIAELDAVVKPIYGESSEWLRSRRRALFSGKPIYGEVSAEGGQEHGQTPVFNAESGQSPVFNAENGQSPPGLAGGNDCGNNGDDGDDGEGSTGESGTNEREYRECDECG